MRTNLAESEAASGRRRFLQERCLVSERSGTQSGCFEALRVLWKIPFVGFGLTAK